MIVHDLDHPSPCRVQASGAIELYFYGELTPAQRDDVQSHLASCPHCSAELEELRVIRDALASRPVVTMPASGDWTRFMARLGDAVAQEAAPSTAATHDGGVGRPRRYVTYLAMAALLTLVTMSVVYVARSRHAEPSSAIESAAAVIAPARTPAGAEPDTDAGAADGAALLTAMSGEHFTRSKLVVLGLATKDAQHATAKDWTYERQLATDLLSDTRLYRMAAEGRGMKTVAGVMRDLELVLLQTSLTDSADPMALGQIQRLIQKRDLIEKISVVTTAGL